MHSDINVKQRHYSAALTKGAALKEDMRVLLKSWEQSESPQEFAQRVQGSDLLGKTTAYRTRDLVLRIFRPRFLVPNDEQAIWLKKLIMNGIHRKIVDELMFLYTARADDLFYDFVINVFWPLCNRGDIIIRNDDVLSFLMKAQDEGVLNEQWSESVKLKVCTTVLGILKDYGFIREEKRGYREIVNYRVSDVTIAYIAYVLHFQGLSDLAVCEHPDWLLFGLERNNLVSRLDELGELAGLIVQRAGSVIRISWKFENMEVFLNGLTKQFI
ncbi:BrxA family protein [Desnuesiella massiliensis]|uniref:BrxA family protein n=1 Tax=Desnuesiella massiliensis TaxID=1650662 RepID=UPI0006E3FDF3|nr:BrxA family protein [Desnuesiella massiliensis]